VDLFSRERQSERQTLWRTCRVHYDIGDRKRGFTFRGWPDLVGTKIFCDSSEIFVSGEPDEAESNPESPALGGQGGNGQQTQTACPEHRDRFTDSGSDHSRSMQCCRKGFDQDRRFIINLFRYRKDAFLGRKQEGTKTAREVVYAEDFSLRAVSGESILAKRAVCFLTQSLVGSVDLGDKASPCVVEGQYFMARDLRQGEGEKPASQVGRANAATLGAQEDIAFTEGKVELTVPGESPSLFAASFYQVMG
jgi:hypothetical protein